MSIPIDSIETKGGVLDDNTRTNYAILNGTEYEFDVIISNGSALVQIANYEELVIEDNIYSVFNSGYLIVDNTYLLSYRFNSKTRDLLHVRIKPVPNSDKQNTLNDDVFALEHVFEIYDQDEVVGSNQTSKFKILHFRDVREQLLDEVNRSWSTADVLKASVGFNINTSQLSDASRAAKTGDSLKWLLKTSLEAFNPKFADDWDIGLTDYFYSSPSEFTMMDDVERLLDQHVSASTGDRCILKYNRANTFELRSFADHFKRSVDKQQKLPGDFTIDIFPIASVAGPYNKEAPHEFNKLPKRSRPERYSYDLAFGVDRFLDMIQYGYCDLASLDSQYISSRAVHSYYPDEGKFYIDMKNTGTKEMAKQAQKLYADSMGSGKSKLLFPSSDRKDANLIFHNVFGADNNAERLSRGQSDVMRDLIYMNNSINFYCDGNTARRSARFFTVTTQVTLQDSNFEKIINGEWFITRVVHHFTGKGYSNDISAVKTYTYEELS